MAKSSSFYFARTLLIVLGVAVSFVAGQNEIVIDRDNLNLTIPNPFGDKPIFETNNQNGRYIGIHIPVLLDVQFLFRDGTGLMNNLFMMELMSGLLEIKYDRLPGPTGPIGPIKILMFGIDLYNNGQ